MGNRSLNDSLYALHRTVRHVRNHIPGLRQGAGLESRGLKDLRRVRFKELFAVGVHVRGGERHMLQLLRPQRH